MSALADMLSTIFERRYRGVREADRDNRSMEELAHDLLGNSGEISGGLVARQILDRYAALSQDEKRAFFEFVTHGLEISPQTVRDTLEAYEKKPSKASYRAFAAACEPGRQEFARRLNRVPGATGKLVDMRHDLLRLLKEHKNLEPLDVDFHHLFGSWFNRGFLVLRPINWDSSASILEKIIEYEAVHAIDSWDDLRRRLKPSDRRCFGFFHPSMSDDPLIFVEVALTRGVPNSVQGLLADEREAILEEDADTAVFYSISNCQAGLAGISFGNSLIKQVVSDLSRDLPNLKTFVTLSPIPGLNKWLGGSQISLLPRDDHKALAAHYLLEAKRPDGFPVDPVARFHLGNGAQIHAVHADADTSDNGMRQSNGVMVNYLYDLNQISQNHEKFAAEKEITASHDVRTLSATVKTSQGD
ncbi:decarboxylase [Rhodophyticola sp. CCM32]|uniref:malonyl-CoA decarboxylase n=1 Tax=Rhodophyticola sp. CCM32 TaxID=2916397 RepID=UPI00107F2B62|nr:malonyl-CoA decarboxylase [Rhodophyticola sp. CCM32]QBX99916.1 decarboxylase [Rhodophyticola sp. CCM32]